MPSTRKTLITNRTEPTKAPEKGHEQSEKIMIKQVQPLPAGIDLEKETVITGRVVDDSGRTIGGAFVRLLDDTDELTAEVVATPAGDFRFFAAPGTWTVRALTKAGHGDVTVAPVGAGLHEIDVKVA
jgi:hypothetical protein